MKRWTRRELLWTAAGTGLVLGCGTATATGPRGKDEEAPRDAGPPEADAGTSALRDAGADPTPACEETEDDIEGPYYLAGAPFRSDLRGAAGGTKLALAGVVRDLACRPVPDALLDFWQADAAGAYDRRGFTFRGRVRADAAGRWAIETIVPGRYLNGDTYRPAHLHVKASAPNGPVLTTQLYFAEDPFNASDPWFDERLMLTPTQAESGLAATFDFAIRT